MKDLKTCTDRSFMRISKGVECRATCFIPRNSCTMSILKKGQLRFIHVQARLPEAGGFLGSVTSSRTRKSRMSVEIAAKITRNQVESGGEI